MKYLKKFETENDRSAYENGESYIEPYVSYVDGGDVHYNKPPFFCKLTLQNGDVVEIEGSGELTQAMISGYSTTCVGAEVGELCTSIGTAAFTYCTGLTSVTIANSVTSIGNYVFQNCYNLISAAIGSGTTSIGSNAFTGCNKLERITSLAATAPTISAGTFYGVKTGGTLYVPIGSTRYDIWMGTGNYYLGKYNWTKVEQ